ncbi:type 1 glutamine amidotransferase [Sphaerisporangium flaviroseum]|uniref:Type 1 glutamine amidotransferase n=1 Tax=Sphaerisporangium flaviroseum TaxID=509199 RepID=A0ABP7JGP8_9ACTN
MGNRVVIIEHEAEAGPGFLAGWLAEAGMTCEIVRPYLGGRVPALDVAADRRQEGAGFWLGGRPADGLIVLGGAASAWDDEGYPWLPATRELIRRSVEASMPTLGICLGAQLMTLACGGEVRPGAAGLEVGLRPVSPLPDAGDDPLFSRLPPSPRALQYHGDAMTVLPPGAVPLATGEPYPNQAYRLGARAWAVQFHPEATPEIFLSWTGPNAGELSGAGFDVAELDAEAVAAREELTETWRPLAEGFAAVVAGHRESVAS